jgi:hypothetical protein
VAAVENWGQISCSGPLESLPDRAWPLMQGLMTIIFSMLNMDMIIMNLGVNMVKAQGSSSESCLSRHSPRVGPQWAAVGEGTSCRGESTPQYEDSIPPLAREPLHRVGMGIVVINVTTT